MSKYGLMGGDPRGVFRHGPTFSPELKRGNVEEAKVWLDLRHVEYQRLYKQWVYAWDHYTGAVIEPENIGKYLVQRTLGENDASYLERVQIADFTPHLGRLSDSLVGMLFQVEVNANRKFGDLDAKGDETGLGRPKDPTSIMSRLWRDADGAGNGWLTVWRQFTTYLTVLHQAWAFLDGRDGEPVIRIYDPTWVLNWKHEGDVLVEALICEPTDTRGSITSIRSQKPEYQYLLLTVDGWRRFQRIKGEKGEVIVRELTDGAGSWEYYTRAGKRTIPLWRAELPLKRNVGYSMARKSNAIFNKESERDHILRVANFPLLNVMGGDTPFDAVVAAIAKGARILKNAPGESNAHHFIAPDTGPASTATEVLNRKVEEFYVTGFKEYGDATPTARERTATEVRASIGSGVAAFLVLLKSAVDDAENNGFFFVEQQQYAGKRSMWGKATVERSDEFLPLDLDTIIDRMRTRYFGQEQTVPIGPQGQMHVLREIAEYDGVQFNEDEAKTAIAIHNMGSALESVKELQLPAEAKARLVVDMLVTFGYVKADEMMKMNDGTEVNMRDFLLQRAFEVARQSEEAIALAAQGGMFGALGPAVRDER